MLSDLIVGYLFIGGAASGLLVLLCALEFANASPTFIARLALPIDFFERAWVACGALLVFAIALLVADLGVSERAFMVLTIPTLSPLTVGAYALALSFFVAAAFCVLSHTSLDYAATIPLKRVQDSPRATARPRYLGKVMHALEIVGVLAGSIAMAYTGIMLASMPSVIAWQTPLLPALFVLSSLSCGIAILFFVAAFTESRQTFFQALHTITSADTLIIVVECVLLIAYFTWCFTNPVTHDSGQALLFGEYAGWLWAGLLTVGLVVPAVLERFITRHNHRTQLLWIAGGILVGGFLLRYLVVALAAYDSSILYTVALGAA